MMDLKELYQACKAFIQACDDDFENDISYLGPSVQRIIEAVSTIKEVYGVDMSSYEVYATREEGVRLEHDPCGARFVREWDISNIEDPPTISSILTAATQHAKTCPAVSHTIPVTTEIDNVKKIVGTVIAQEHGTFVAEITDGAVWDKIKDKGPYSIGN